MLAQWLILELSDTGRARLHVLTSNAGDDGRTRLASALIWQGQCDRDVPIGPSTKG